MTLAEQFLNEVKQHDSEGKLKLKLFLETMIKYKGCFVDGSIEFEDESYAYYDSNIFEWVWNMTIEDERCFVDFNSKIRFVRNLNPKDYSIDDTNNFISLLEDCHGEKHEIAKYDLHDFKALRKFLREPTEIVSY
jgi:hypothetical protein